MISELRVWYTRAWCQPAHGGATDALGIGLYRYRPVASRASALWSCGRYLIVDDIGADNRIYAIIRAKATDGAWQTCSNVNPTLHRRSLRAILMPYVFLSGWRVTLCLAGRRRDVCNDMHCSANARYVVYATCRILAMWNDIHALTRLHLRCMQSAGQQITPVTSYLASRVYRCLPHQLYSLHVADSVA